MWGTCQHSITIKRSRHAFVRSVFDHVSKCVDRRLGHTRLDNGFIMRSYLGVFWEMWNIHARQGNLSFWFLTISHVAFLYICISLLLCQFNTKFMRPFFILNSFGNALILFLYFCTLTEYLLISSELWSIDSLYYVYILQWTQYLNMYSVFDL